MKALFFLYHALALLLVSRTGLSQASRIRGNRNGNEQTRLSEVSTIAHLGSQSTWIPRAKTITIKRPSQSEPGDLLLLFLSRTDDYLPLYLDGWITGPACLKTENRQDTCHTVDDCTKWSGDYCMEFGHPYYDGGDLATAVFYRIVQTNEPSQYIFDLWCWDRCKPAWAILTALRGADRQYPIVDSATMSMDFLEASGFPSVEGGSPGDKLLLYMAFDDGYDSGVHTLTFQPPEGTTRYSYIIGEDEAGFLFAEDLTSWGETGQKITRGPGIRFRAKDASKTFVLQRVLVECCLNCLLTAHRCFSRPHAPQPQVISLIVRKEY